MTKRLRRLAPSTCAISLLAAFAVAPPATRAADCAGADRLPVAATMEAAKDATLCLLNNERVSRGLQPFTRQSQLEAAATSYSQLLVAERFFAHATPLGQAAEQRLASYTKPALRWKVAENLGWAASVHATPRAIVEAWMHSDVHRPNILHTRYREVGIGIVSGTPTGLRPARSVTYAVEFGWRTITSPRPRADAVPPTSRKAGRAQLNFWKMKS